MAPRRSLVLRPVLGIHLEVDGDHWAARHFAAEYGGIPASTAAEGDVAQLQVRFVSTLDDADLRDRHKTVSWSARIDWPELQRMVLTIALRGRPRWFGLSLVQGYLVEPALSLLAPGIGRVLLPAGAVVVDGSALVLVGGSGAGKSSLALRALAAGLPVLGDDQVVVAADGTCTRFPRRLRIYDDSARTAPAAIAGLPASYRRGLQVRRLLRRLSFGFVAPSLAIPPAAVAGSVPASRAPLGRIVLLKRAPAAETAASRPVELATVLERCGEVLADQRRRLVARSAGLAARLDLDAVVLREREILTGAFRDIPATEVTSPGAHGAAAGVAAVAKEIGLP